MYTLAQLRESRLCDAAELLAQRGLDNVRAAELARATRLSVGSLYRYYGSKQGIARAIRTLTERDLSYACFVAYQMADGDPLRQGFRDVFLAFWRELATWALLQPHLVGFTFLHPHPDADTPGEHDGRTRAQVLEVLEHGEREGAFPKGRTWIHECMVWGVLAELVRRAGQGEGMREEDVQITGEALWRALAPEAPGNESRKPAPSACRLDYNGCAMNRTSLLSLCVAVSLAACTERSSSPAAGVDSGAAAAAAAASAPTGKAQTPPPAPSTEPQGAGGLDAAVPGSATANADSGVGEYTNAPAAEKGTCSAAKLSPRVEPATPALPAPVESMRQRIVAAAVACDYTALNTLADENGKAVRFTFGDSTDAGEYWRAAEKLGNPDLARIVQVLNLPYAKQGNLYFWPAVHVTGATSDKDWGAVKGIYSEAEIAGMKDHGAYLGLRVGITPEGDWQIAVAGD
ncbi:TetR/AcrR family transcriptional regulator [Corallococcus macrosporus]|uniref:HTH tetR-type domain-containing protein n=2 Tax=Myxococcaceae TaxID=31 RepID=A0A250K0J5_9BACT|nr:TetR/AcrR family transcriptional regulator [Corallococcus macrosporus]AEI68643.1 hypothetical protein LILAB_33810 [Corallococcus macrosporus]ATB49410.1 hypothetical protein MYMAC_005054 [Corallococcus macrosporus DSM 14697]